MAVDFDLTTEEKEFIIRRRLQNSNTTVLETEYNRIFLYFDLGISKDKTFSINIRDKKDDKIVFWDNISYENLNKFIEEINMRNELKKELIKMPKIKIIKDPF